jgi:ABC-type uncharacterized transport system YnjBCD ATPase subunit
VTAQTPLEPAREDLILIAAGARTVTADLLAEPIARLEKALRNEIANDVHRANKPVFAATEDPVLVVKTTRAIDVRLIEMGSQAPYWVPEGGAR